MNTVYKDNEALTIAQGYLHVMDGEIDDRQYEWADHTAQYTQAAALVSIAESLAAMVAKPAQVAGSVTVTDEQISDLVRRIADAGTLAGERFTVRSWLAEVQHG